MIRAEVPRVRCPEHGIRQLRVPWAEENSRFTALLEVQVIEWLKEASILAVARLLGLGWSQVAGIQKRAVTRGLARRQRQPPRLMGVDETSFRKRHDYVTLVNDLSRHVVLEVADGRGRETLDSYFRSLGESGCAAIEEVAMDMWRGYIGPVEEHTDARIVFDKFHIAAHLSKAVDSVRRQEHRELRRAGAEILTGSRYLWLMNPRRMSRKQRLAFAPLRDSSLKVSRAWAIKERAMSLWGYSRRGWAERMWKRWYAWAIRSRLEPVKEVARMIRRHWQGVLNAATSNVTNARSEAINAKIQWIKRQAHGYRNKSNFRYAILFHLGGLQLYPDAFVAHTTS